MIPAEAVEAAAKAVYESRYMDMRTWEDLDESSKDAEREEQAIALEAAAPYIAGAWHDAVSEAYVEGTLSAEQANIMWAKNPHKGSS